MEKSVNTSEMEENPMNGKRVSESAVHTAQLMSPQDANAAGNVHGGVIMKLIDDAGGAVAYRHARSNVVTVSIDRLNFLNPIFVGDLVTFKASINMAGKSSMDIGVRVEAENLITGQVRHAASAYHRGSGDFGNCRRGTSLSSGSCPKGNSQTGTGEPCQIGAREVILT